MAAEKEYVTADALVRDAFRLARLVYDSGWRPDILVALWRGGTPVAVAVHEFLLYKGIETHHTVLKVESYAGIGRRAAPRMEGMDGLLAAVTPGSRVLVVDDIFDTGLTVEAVGNALRGWGVDMRVATLYCKRGAALTDLRPDYHLRETDRWVVFPHELVGLTPEEIRQKDEHIHSLLG